MYKTLSKHFEGVAAKRLSAVESDISRSNQHELNGAGPLRELLGENKKTYKANFLFLDDEGDNLKSEQFMTWYDSREKNPKRSAEFRLYFPDSSVTETFQEGNIVIVGKLTNGEIILVTARQGTTSESQLLWLFNIPSGSLRSDFNIVITQHNDKDMNFSASQILEAMGIESAEESDEYLDEMLKQFSETFPTTKVFSEYARSKIDDLIVSDNPDFALMSFIEMEEKLFRTLEHHIVSQKLVDGFGVSNTDVDGFISFSLSVHNRRKSRVGYALENHFEFILRKLDIQYSRGKITENRSRPDFIFPGHREYRNPDFLPAKLDMLGVKSTAKDRWRQVLVEAQRINNKHLLTLEPGISENQTNQMQVNELQLVSPAPLHNSYNDRQRKWLINVQEFLDYIRQKQSA